MPWLRQLSGKEGRKARNSDHISMPTKFGSGSCESFHAFQFELICGKPRNMESGRVKRNLRVVKWLGQLPATRVCSPCNRQFQVLMTAMKRIADGQESLRVQFASHKCNPEDSGPSRCGRRHRSYQGVRNNIANSGWSALSRFVRPHA
jgi:hypothetical protein